MEPAADERRCWPARFLPVDFAAGGAEALAAPAGPALKALDRKPVYVDCNAVSPQTAIRSADRCPERRRFVDGGIIGGPPGQAIARDLRLGSERGQIAVLRD